jgi:hypothetical protein
VGNQVEEAAIKFVIAGETAEGRSARDARREPGVPTDIVSGDRLIEVKAYGGSARGHDLWLEPAQVAAALASPERFWLYVVDNVSQGDPEQFRLRASVAASGRTCWRAARSAGTSRFPFR